MDKLIITDLEVQAHVGVKEDERAVAQTLMFNFTGFSNFDKVALSDDVEDTGNYATMTKTIIKIVEETRYHTLEALGFHILKEMFAKFPLHEATIRIEKPKRVKGTRLVGIEMTRKATDFK